MKCIEDVEEKDIIRKELQRKSAIFVNFVKMTNIAFFIVCIKIGYGIIYNL